MHSDSDSTCIEGWVRQSDSAIGSVTEKKEGPEINKDRFLLKKIYKLKKIGLHLQWRTTLMRVYPKSSLTLIQFKNSVTEPKFIRK